MESTVRCPDISSKSKDEHNHEGKSSFIDIISSLLPAVWISPGDDTWDTFPCHLASEKAVEKKSSCWLKLELLPINSAQRTTAINSKLETLRNTRYEIRYLKSHVYFSFAIVRKVDDNAQ